MSTEIIVESQDTAMLALYTACTVVRMDEVVGRSMLRTGYPIILKSKEIRT